MVDAFKTSDVALSDLPITPDPAKGLDAADADEAINELAEDTHELKQKAILHITTDW